jgi:hypothetical protein
MPLTPASGRPDPIQSRILTDKAMTSGYLYSQFGAPWRVNADSYKRAEFDLQANKLALREATYRAPGQNANQMKGGDITWTTGQLKARALSAPLEDEVLAECEGPELESKFRTAHIEMITNRLELEAELQLLSLLTTTGGSIANASPGTKWDGVSPTIMADIQAAIREMHRLSGVFPTHGIMPFEVAEVVFNSDDYQNRVKYVAGQLAPQGFPYLAPFLGINWVVPTVRENTSATVTPALAHVWDLDTVVLAHLDPSAGSNPKALVPVRTFYGGSMEIGGATFDVTRWRESDPTYHTEWWAAEWKWNMEIVCGAAAYILNDVLT